MPWLAGPAAYAFEFLVFNTLRRCRQFSAGWVHRLATTPRRRALLALVLPLAASACGDDTFTGVATNSNVSRTFSVFALTGTPTVLPAAYFFINETAVRPQLVGSGTTNFEVAFDLTANNDVLVMPARTVVAAAPSTVYSVGLQKSTVAYEALTLAPEQGYVRDSVFTAKQGDVFIVQLINSGCTFGEPVYAKMAVDSVIVAERRLVLSVLVNRNCRFRALTPGLPAN